MGKLRATSTDCPALMGVTKGGVGGVGCIGLVGIYQDKLAMAMSYGGGVTSCTSVCPPTIGVEQWFVGASAESWRGSWLMALLLQRELSAFGMSLLFLARTGSQLL